MAHREAGFELHRGIKFPDGVFTAVGHPRGFFAIGADHQLKMKEEMYARQQMVVLQKSLTGASVGLATDSDVYSVMLTSTRAISIGG